MPAKNEEQKQPSHDLSTDHNLEDIEVGSEVGLLSSSVNSKKKSGRRTPSLWYLHSVTLLFYTLLLLVFVYRTTPNSGCGLETYCKLLREITNVS